MWRGGNLVVTPSLHACRSHNASTAQARGAAPVPLLGGGHALWLPWSPSLPCVRTPGGPPCWGSTARALYGHGCVVRPAPSRRCLPTLPLCPRGGGTFRPPLPASPTLWGAEVCVWGGGGRPCRLPSAARTSQARRKHGAGTRRGTCPSAGGGGGLDVCHPSSPLLPCVRTPGGAEVCVWGGRRPCHRPFCCTHVAGTTQARRKHGVRHLAEVRVGFRTRTAHGTTHGNYPLPCPLCSLPRPLCLLGAEQSPCLPRRSLSLPRLSGLPSPPKCPTSFTLPVPSFLVLASPRCMTLRRHTAHCTFRGRAALWQHAAAPRLAQCPRALRAARSVVGQPRGWSRVSRALGSCPRTK